MCRRRNLAQYFRKNPDWEEYFGQDKADYQPPTDQPHQPQPPQLAPLQQSVPSYAPSSAGGARKRRREYDSEEEDGDEVLFSDRFERALEAKQVNIGNGGGRQGEYRGSGYQGLASGYAQLPRTHRGHAPSLDEMKHSAQVEDQERAVANKQQEAQEARRWREHSTIQCIIDHYNTGPTTSPRFSELW